MNTSTETHKRYILIIAGIILLSSALILGLNYYSIKILSSLRAYVNAESEYSKGQKDATRYLIDYIETSDIQSYIDFKLELSVPVGDSIAREAFQNGKSRSFIRKGFLQGRNHPDDIENLIWLFQKFQHYPYFKEAIAQWIEADQDIAKLDEIGYYIYSLNNQKLNASTQTALKTNVATINRRLTFKLQYFSNILGEASRIIPQALLFINIFFVLLILISAGLYARRMFAVLVESRRLILEQNSAKDEFLSIASHELKTPLTSMKASLQILERFIKTCPGSEKIQPFVFNSNKQVNRLIDLVKELLDVTRIQSGKLEIQRKPLEFDELIKEVVAEKNAVTGNRLVIENLAEGIVEADSNRIYQVFENLISNAIKYSPGSGQITICSQLKSGYIRVSVKDSGAGIQKEKIPYLFDRFYRIEETSYSVQGLGLGLYICKEIIRSHNGEIGAESEIGKGSTFWFSLPLASSNYQRPVILQAEKTNS